MEVVEGCGGVGEEVVVDFGLDGVGGCFAGHGGYGARTNISPVKLLTVVVLYVSLCERAAKKGRSAGRKARDAESGPSEQESSGDSRLFSSFRSIRSRIMYSHNTAASFPSQCIRFQW